MMIENIVSGETVHLLHDNAHPQVANTMQQTFMELVWDVLQFAYSRVSLIPLKATLLVSPEALRCWVMVIKPDPVDYYY